MEYFRPLVAISVYYKQMRHHPAPPRPRLNLAVRKMKTASTQKFYEKKKKSCRAKAETQSVPLQLTRSGAEKEQ